MRFAPSKAKWTRTSHTPFSKLVPDFQANQPALFFWASPQTPVSKCKRTPYWALGCGWQDENAACTYNSKRQSSRPSGSKLLSKQLWAGQRHIFGPISSCIYSFFAPAGGGWNSKSLVLPHLIEQLSYLNPYLYKILLLISRFTS